MSKTFRSKTLSALAAGFVMTALPVFGQGVPVEGPLPTTATIAVQSKSGAPLDPALLTLQVDGKDTPILSVKPIPPPGAQIAILIDDGLRSSFGNQITDFANFINALPPGTKVLVGYMRNGMVRGMNRFRRIISLRWTSCGCRCSCRDQRQPVFHALRVFEALAVE